LRLLPLSAGLAARTLAPAADGGHAVDAAAPADGLVVDRKSVV
jgi:hypothetical protein